MQTNADRYYITYKIGGTWAKMTFLRNQIHLFNSSVPIFALVAWHRHCGYFCVHFLSLWGLVPISLLIFHQMQANADRVGSTQAKYHPCNRFQLFKSSAHPFELVAWHRHCGYSCIRFRSLWGLATISLSIFDQTQANADRYYADNYYITY